MDEKLTRQPLDPTVSVIIPCFNAKHYIADAIASALAQTYVPLEIIVIDDGSSDGSYEYIKETYCQQVRLFRQQNQGPSAARNAGVQNAKGEWCAFLDADDIWVETKLEEQVRVLTDHESVILVACEAMEMRPDGTSSVTSQLPQPFTREAQRRALLQRNAIIIPGTFIRRITFLEAGGFNTKLRCGEDWEFCARMFSVGEIAAVHKPLVKIRVVPGSASQDPVNALDGTLRVHRMIWPLLAPPGANLVDGALAVMRLDSQIYLSVAWLHGLQGNAGKGLWCWVQSMIRWPLWPIESSRTRIGVLLQLLKFRAYNRHSS